MGIEQVPLLACALQRTQMCVKNNGERTYRN